MKALLLFFAVLFSAVAIPAAEPKGVPVERGENVAAPVIYFPAEAPVLAVSRALPLMGPDLALQAYLGRARRQSAELGGYSDMTVIEAALPSSKQSGRYELRRTFSAPKSLAFQAIRFVGDNFVKSNVIVRLLQSEVDHVEKSQGAETAISEENYKFKFKTTERRYGRVTHAYEVKPRSKRPGLFQGRIHVDAFTGSIQRAEGKLVKSPSIFIKKVEFVQEYADVDGFSLPVRLHSVTRTRLVGDALVTVQHTNYQARNVAKLQGESDSVATQTERN